jgi:hypothetical protein
MQNVKIIFTDNGWYLPGGFIAVLFFFSIPLVVAWQNRRMPALAWLFPLVGVIFGIWVLDFYAKATFGSFTSLERKGAVIRFYYYYGQPREFQWQDVQKIVREGGRGGVNIRIYMRNGTELISYSTSSEAVIARALSLNSQIH